MGIHRSNQTKKTVIDTPPEPAREEMTPELAREEIIWLMNLIKDGTFRGSDVQTVYETVVKLQLMLNKKG